MKKPFLILTLVTLTSCSVRTDVISYLTDEDEGTATISIYKNNNSESTERYIAPRNVNVEYTYSSLAGTLYGLPSVLPSVGTSNLLVIPCHIHGSEQYKTDEVVSDIREAFFGSGEKLGYPSVSEYYETSSYGKCHLKGEVTDWFDISKTSLGYDLSAITSSSIKDEIVKKAVEWAVSDQGINPLDYDSDEDGYIDAVYLVYDHLDYETVIDKVIDGDTSYTYDDISSVFSNFTDHADSEADKENPSVSGFSWCSFNSMYKGFSDGSIDTHPFIHETGHLFGLKDYAGDDGSYNPMGQFTMMDSMTGDLDSYSKICLGWITPYVVYGTSKILIETANKNDHSVIVIPSDFEDISKEIEAVNKSNSKDTYSYSFNPFSEYLLIDLYSGDGLNAPELEQNAASYSEAAVYEAGVRIYHVDSRLFVGKTISYSGGTKLSITDTHWDGETLGSDELLLSVISNSRTESSEYGISTAYDYLDQIRLIEANKLNTFSDGGIFNDKTLWNTESNPFSITDYGYQYFNSNYSYNDGNELPFNIKVNTLEDIAHE